ncbi:MULTISPECIES: Na+/H+ antiporter subunit D [Kytococcus]|uniref:Na+/H+ antiporter subunit D n=1 Tax=Kytococcus schroeteri TaxID=138300 RepID=A0A2I1PAM7_9MICO|nr:MULTISPECIES: Na+/H+ antiporter subunit D [Kytococcus]OFS06262.1 Na+/H+ antiporter subunit D [Kytococcus sp. HMSC28H12]PKZ41631.1 Na+/H+ antiporter subunit D [Kytococcus schroeteri]
MTPTPDVLVPLPVVVPLVAAGLTLVANRRTGVQRAVTVAALTTSLVVAALLVHLSDTRGPQVVQVGGWAPTEGIALVADRLASLMVLVSVLVTLAVVLYSIGEGRSSFDEESDGQSPLPIFHPTLLVLSAGVSTTFLSGDLFHLYVGFEMLLVASFVLLTLGGTRARVRAGTNYVAVSLVSSAVFLTAIALVYAATGTVNLAHLAHRLAEVDADTRLALELVLLLGFGIKAAVFPMQGWLPDSYPTAPASVTAVFAGLLTKVGVYAIIRTEVLLFPDDRVSPLLLGAAALTMVVGILGAIVQDDIKRMLSFTLVSHIGFMIFGIALGGELGLSAAIFYVVHHILIQSALFLVTGLVERRGGTSSSMRLDRLATASPLVAVLFFVPAMNLGGIPPFSGFLAKVGLIEAGLYHGGWLAYTLVGASLLTSLLTLYALTRTWARAFWRRPFSEDGHPLRDLPDPDRDVSEALVSGVVGPTVLLVGVGLALSVAAGPVYAYTDRAAHDLLGTTVYTHAVFPDGVPR